MGEGQIWRGHIEVEVTVNIQLKIGSKTTVNQSLRVLTDNIMVLVGQAVDQALGGDSEVQMWRIRGLIGEDQRGIRILFLNKEVKVHCHRAAGI